MEQVAWFTGSFLLTIDQFQDSSLVTVEQYQVTYCKCGMGEIDFPSIPKLCYTILTPKVFHLLIIDQLQDSSLVTVEQNQVTFRALLIFVGLGKWNFHPSLNFAVQLWLLRFFICVWYPQKIYGMFNTYTMMCVLALFLAAVDQKFREHIYILISFTCSW